MLYVGGNALQEGLLIEEVDVSDGRCHEMNTDTVMAVAHSPSHANRLEKRHNNCGFVGGWKSVERKVEELWKDIANETHNVRCCFMRARVCPCAVSADGHCPFTRTSYSKSQ